MDSKLPQCCIPFVRATKGVEWLELHPFEKQCDADDGTVAIKHVINFSTPCGIASQLKAYPTRPSVSLRTTGVSNPRSTSLVVEERLLRKYPEMPECKDALRTAQHPFDKSLTDLSITHDFAVCRPPLLPPKTPLFTSLNCHDELSAIYIKLGRCPSIKCLIFLVFIAKFGITNSYHSFTTHTLATYLHNIASVFVACTT